MWIDGIFAVVAAAAFFYGYQRGIIKTVASIAAVFLGFIAAVRFAKPATNILANLFNTEPTGAMPLVGFLVAFFAVLMILNFSVKMVERILSAARLSFINQFIGGVTIALAAVLVFSILLGFVDSADLIPVKQKEESFTYEALNAFPNQAYAALGQAMPSLDNLREAGKSALESAEESAEESEKVQ